MKIPIMNAKLENLKFNMKIPVSLETNKKLIKKNLIKIRKQMNQRD